MSLVRFCFLGLNGTSICHWSQVSPQGIFLHFKICLKIVLLVYLTFTAFSSNNYCVPISPNITDWICVTIHLSHFIQAYWLKNVIWHLKANAFHQTHFQYLVSNSLLCKYRQLTTCSVWWSYKTRCFILLFCPNYDRWKISQVLFDFSRDGKN